MRFDDRADGLGVVVSGHAHQDVHFADIDELAEKIIRQKHSPPSG